MNTVLNTTGTPIILSNLSIKDLSLRSESDIQDEQNQLLNNIENWKKSCEANDGCQYINFYSDLYETNSSSSGRLLKKMFLKNLRHIKISLENISIYEYPSDLDREQLRIVIFSQNYKSNLISNLSKKKQIWKIQEWRSGE